MKRLMTSLFLLLLLGGTTLGHVIEHKGELRVLRTLSGASQNGSSAIELRGFPSFVSLSGGRQENGWFLVVTEQNQKLYWWRFVLASDAASAAEWFTRSCLVHVGTKLLGVFCTTNSSLLAAKSTQTYSTASGITKLVESEFAQKASRLDSGIDYFDQNLALQPVLGKGFFSEPGRADSISQVRLLSVNRTGEDWQVLVAGARQLVTRVTLSSDFTVRGSAVVR